MTSNGVLPLFGFLSTEGEACHDVLSELQSNVTSVKRHERVCEIVILENEKMFLVDMLVS